MTAIAWLVGLGNPGAEYDRQRHNIGFRLVDAIHQQGQFTPWQPMGKDKMVLVAKGNLAPVPQPLWLVKPMGYMNLSGQVLQGAMARAQPKVTIDQLLVLHDEIVLEFGQVRIKQGGGDAGHNGLRDISARLGNHYHRFRFGVGHPGAKDLVSDHVLGNFTRDEEGKLAKLIPLAAEHFHYIVSGQAPLFLQHWTPASQKIVAG